MNFKVFLSTIESKLSSEVLLMIQYFTQIKSEVHQTPPQFF
jgi:hypothetical protein